MGGFFGVVSKKECTNFVFYGTDYHSHLGTRRGGMAVTSEDGSINSTIHDISNVQFRAKFETDLNKLKGNCGIGVISDYDDQPLTIHSRLGTYSIISVGKINNLKELVAESFNDHHSGHFLEMSGGIINPTEVIATLINQKSSFLEGIQYAMSKIKGSCSLLVMSQNSLYAARDRYGRTPVFIGKSDDGYAVTMEDAAFLNMGFRCIKELGSGQIIKLTADSMTELAPAQKEMQICAFLWVYYGYPSSNYEGQNSEVVRNRNGIIMHENGPKPPVDYVCGVPDSGVGHAIGYSNVAGAPYGRALIKYTPTWARSFMPSEQCHRDLVAKMKLIPVEELIKNKKLLFCDDSIVRGTTCRRIISQLRQAGAKEIHMRVSAPPFVAPCYYGTDIDSAENLIANQHTVEEIAELIGVDSLGYLSLEHVRQLTGRDSGFCTACFGGGYPTAVPDVGQKDRFEEKIHKSNKEPEEK